MCNYNNKVISGVLILLHERGGGGKTQKRARIFFPEALVSAKNGTDFTVIKSFIKIMTHVGYSEIYLR